MLLLLLSCSLLLYYNYSCIFFSHHFLIKLSVHRSFCLLSLLYTFGLPGLHAECLLSPCAITVCHFLLVPTRLSNVFWAIPLRIHCRSQIIRWESMWLLRLKLGNRAAAPSPDKIVGLLDLVPRNVGGIL